MNNPLPNGYQFGISFRFQVERQIGSGAFGETYIVLDRHAFSRKCLLKLFSYSDSNPENEKKAAELFERECDTLYQLTHEKGSPVGAIPSFISFIEEDNKWLLVEEYIEGITLGDLLKDPQKNIDAIDVVEDILNILCYLHRKVGNRASIIHRDIKPENIIIKNVGGASLIDFGAVKQELITSGLVKLNTSIGTLGYQPQEQSMGGAYPSSDLYSLGVTAIQCLTGKPPDEFMNGYELAWSEEDRKKIEPRLQSFLKKMVEKDHNRRYLSAEDALKGLQSARKTLLVPGVGGLNNNNIKMSRQLGEKIILGTLAVSVVFFLSWAVGSLFNKPSSTQPEPTPETSTNATPTNTLSPAPSTSTKKTPITPPTSTKKTPITKPTRIKCPAFYDPDDPKYKDCEL